MLGWEVVEGQWLIAILDQAFDCLGLSRFEGFNEQIEGGIRIFSRFCLPDIMQHFLGLGLVISPT